MSSSHKATYDAFKELRKSLAHNTDIFVINPKTPLPEGSELYKFELKHKEY